MALPGSMFYNYIPAPHLVLLVFLALISICEAWMNSAPHAQVAR